MEIKGNINAGYGNSITGGTKSSIVGGENNSVSGDWSSIGGGFNNTIPKNVSIIGAGYNNTNEGGAAFIGAGSFNTIENDQNFSSIVGGKSNTISGKTVTAHNFIGGGQDSSVLDSTFSVIVGGYNNRNRYNGSGFIGGGKNNTIEPSLIGGSYNGHSYCSIVGGYNNSITHYTTVNDRGNHLIVSGKHVDLNGYSYYGHNVVVAGGATKYSGLAGRKGATISFGSGNFIGNGGPGYFGIDGTVSGATHGVLNGYRSTVINGYNNVVNNSDNSTILHGYYNYILSSGVNTVVGGSQNHIYFAGTSNIIGAGTNNTIERVLQGGANFSPQQSSILSGQNNKIAGYSNRGIIGSGQNNYIFNSRKSFIGGGDGNTIGGDYRNAGAILPYTIFESVIVGGNNNTITGATSDYSSILGGQNNIVNNHTNAHIIGSNLTSISANTTHVEKLNIGTLNGTTPITNLALDANGFVVDGSSLSGGTFCTLITETISACTNHISFYPIGNVGVKTSNPTFDFEVNGTFGATSKSFDIPHPTKEGKRLRYGSLEGPEYGVYVRGKLSGENIIELSEHWTGLVDENSITVQLTPYGRKQDLFIGEIINNTVEVLGDESPECYYIVLGERKDIDRITVEY